MNNDEMSFKDFVKKFELNFNGLDYLYVPMESISNLRILLVVLSTHNQKHYMLAKTFLEDQKFDLLFLKDEKNSYYFEDDNGKRYLDLLRRMIKDDDCANVCFLGASMSGFASLRFALVFNANCICCNPQVDLNLSKNFSWSQLTYDIENVKTTFRFEQYVSSRDYDGVIYFLSGHHNLDVINRKAFLSYNFPHAKVILHTLSVKNHDFFIGRNVDYLYDVIVLINLFRRLDDSETTLPNLSPLSVFLLFPLTALHD